MKFPHLYECSVCGSPVRVTVVADAEPIKEFSCGHVSAKIWANRKVTLYGKGDISVSERWSRSIRLTLRQFLSALTGRSV